MLLSKATNEDNRSHQNQQKSNNIQVLYCPTKTKDLNSLECETEKMYFKVFLSSQIN